LGEFLELMNTNLDTDCGDPVFTSDLEIMDHIAILNRNVVAVSPAAVLLGEEGSSILRHELAHSLYFYMQKNRFRISKESKTSFNRHNACTRMSNNINFFIGSGGIQFQSEDYADMVSALTATAKDDNAFCSMAGKYIMERDLNSVFPFNGTVHSPALKRAMFYQFTKEKKLPMTCQAIIKSIYGDEIDNKACLPKKAQ
jgi:hypothetical protein